MRKRQFCRSFDSLGAEKSTASTFNILEVQHIAYRRPNNVRAYIPKTYKCNYVKVLILKQPESLC